MNIQKATQNGIVKHSNIERANEIFTNVHADNTNDAYQKDIELYLNWCEDNDKLPKFENSFFEYLTELSHTLKYSTIQRKSVSLSKNITGLDKKALSNFLKGVSNITQKEGNTSTGAKAVSIEAVKKMVDYYTPDTLTGLRNKAMLLTGFFGALRASELINIKKEHLTIDADGITILIPRSKTDQTGKGQYKFIPQQFSDYCPVRALSSWILESGIEDGFLFRAIKKGGKMQDNGLTRQNAYMIVRGGKTKMIDKKRKIVYAFPEFSTHSLRAGFVTVSSENNATIQQIQQQTGHKTAQMILHYTRSKDVKKNNSVNNISI